MIFLALALSMGGATLVYLASPRQGLLSIPPHDASRLAAMAALVGGGIAWHEAAGTSAGIAATLTTWMLTWVALPYLAWWRSTVESTRAGSR